jgi:hypothetical protein
VLDLKTALTIMGIILGAMALLALGGFFGKRAEVFRVAITSGIVVLVAIVIFVIYSAVFLLTGQG